MLASGARWGGRRLLVGRTLSPVSSYFHWFSLLWFSPSCPFCSEMRQLLQWWTTRCSPYGRAVGAGAAARSR